MIRERLLFAARCVDVALFAAGVAYVVLWGWPSTGWGWFWLSGAFLPLISWGLWRLVKSRLDARAARKTMAYRRQKFGGFIAVPGARDGKRAVLPVDRPDA